MFSRGVTFVELVVSIAIMIALATLSFAVLREGNPNRSLDQAEEYILSGFEDARARTLGADGGQQYGIYLATTTITLFKGDTYSKTDPHNRITTLPRQVRIATTTLSGGVNTIIFERLTGYTTSTGTLTLIHEGDSYASSTAIIEETGILFFE